MVVGWQRALSVAAIVTGCAAQPPSLPEGSGAGSGSDTGTGAADSASDDGGSGPSSADATTSAGDTTGSVDSEATDDATGSGPRICGDGITDADEDCDDANGVEIDGCTSTCEVGPIGIVWSETLEDSDVVTWNGANGLDVVSDCPPGEVLQRIEVFETLVFGTAVVAGFIGRCSNATLQDANPTSVVLTPSGALPTVGGSSTSAGELACEGGLTGFAARIDFSRATAVGATCREYQVTVGGGTQSLQLGPAVNLPPIVGDGLVPGQATECPPGQVAVGLRAVLIDGNPGSLGLRCRQPSLLYPPR